MALQNGLHQRGWLGQMLRGRLGHLSDNDNDIFCIEGYDILSCSRLNKKREE